MVIFVAHLKYFLLRKKLSEKVEQAISIFARKNLRQFVYTNPGQSFLSLCRKITSVILVPKYSHKSKRVTRYQARPEGETHGVQIDVASTFERSRVPSMKGERKLNVARFRSSLQDRVVEYIDSCIRGGGARRKCIQRSRNLHPWRVRDRQLVHLSCKSSSSSCSSLFLSSDHSCHDVPRRLFLSFVAYCATCILLSGWYLVYWLV